MPWCPKIATFVISLNSTAASRRSGTSNKRWKGMLLHEANFFRNWCQSFGIHINRARGKKVLYVEVEVKLLALSCILVRAPRQSASCILVNVVHTMEYYQVPRALSGLILCSLSFSQICWNYLSCPQSTEQLFSDL